MVEIEITNLVPECVQLYSLVDENDVWSFEKAVEKMRKIRILRSCPCCWKTLDLTRCKKQLSLDLLTEKKSQKHHV